MKSESKFKKYYDKWIKMSDDEILKEHTIMEDEDNDAYLQAIQDKGLKEKYIEFFS